MSEFTMPYQREKERDEKGSSRDKRLFRPLPDKAGQVVNNDVIIPLFSPHNWKMFNPDPETAAKYGMVGSGLVSMNPSAPISTFYFRLPVHNVQNFNHPDGTMKFGQILCPLALNKYLVESLGRGPLFDQPRCAFCEEEQRHWDAYNKCWDTCGTDKRSLSKDGYWKFVDNHPVLSAERDAARKFGVDTRFVIGVFDHAKFVGTRPKDEGEETVEHQIWFSPKSIYQKLLALYEAMPGGFRFFEPTDAGFPVLSVVKNTTECKAGDLRNTKYDIMFVNRYHPYPPEWVQYIMNQGAMIDPSDFVHMITYEEGLYYAEREKTSATEYGEAAATGAPAAGQPTGYPTGQPTGQPMGAPPAQGYVPPGAPPAQGYVPPVSTGTPPGAPPSSGAVSPDGYAVPAGTMPPGAPPAGQPPAVQPPPGAPPGAPPAQQSGAPIPPQPPAAQPVPVSTPGGTVPVVDLSQPPGAPPAQQPPGAPPGAPPAQPGAAAPPGFPPAQQPPGAPPGAPPAQTQTPPTTAPPQGAPPERTPPGGEDPPGRRRSW